MAIEMSDRIIGFISDTFVVWYFEDRYMVLLVQSLTMHVLLRLYDPLVTNISPITAVHTNNFPLGLLKYFWFWYMNAARVDKTVIGLKVN